MENMYTIADIVKITGLKEKFIRNCVENLKNDVLKDSIKRGNKNSLLFDSNALTIFDFIKQKYESGYSISTIKQELLEGNLGKTESETEVNLPPPDSLVSLVNELKTLNNTVLKAKDEMLEKEREIFVKEKQIIEQSHLITHLKDNLKLITDGRSPEEVREEQIKKELELKRHQEELSNLKESLKSKDNEMNSIKVIAEVKDKEIQTHKKQLEDLENTYKTKEKSFEKEKEELENRVKQKELKRKELLDELALLEGKWFVGTKRKDLLNKLKELS